jgi:hypothetical protein
MPDKGRIMDRTLKIFWKALGSGLLGIGVFVILLLIISMLLPRRDYTDIPDGFAAGFLLILNVAISMFFSGAIAIFLTYKDDSPLKYVLAVPLFSGLVTSIPALLIALVLALVSIGLFLISLIVILICLLIAEAGGLIVYIFLYFVRGPGRPATSR